MTRAQKHVLQCLIDGWVLSPAGKDELGGVLQNRPGETRSVSAKTMNFLFSEGFISTGDAYFPWIITENGRLAVTPDTR